LSCRASKDNKASLPTEQHIIVSCDSESEAKRNKDDVLHLIDVNKRFECWELKDDIKPTLMGDRFYYTLSCNSGQDSIVDIINGGG